MSPVIFAEDNPLAATWFELLHRACALAMPGPRAPRVLAIEASLLDKLEQVSDAHGGPEANGFQPRRLRAPCTVPFDPREHALAVAYLGTAAFQPYLSRCVLALQAALADAAPKDRND